MKKYNKLLHRGAYVMLSRTLHTTLYHHKHGSGKISSKTKNSTNRHANVQSNLHSPLSDVSIAQCTAINRK